MRLRNLVHKFCSCLITIKSTYWYIFKTLLITEIAFIVLLESLALKEGLSSGQPWGHFQRHRSGLHEQITNYFFLTIAIKGYRLVSELYSSIFLQTRYKLAKMNKKYARYTYQHNCHTCSQKPRHFVAFQPDVISALQLKSIICVHRRMAVQWREKAHKFVLLHNLPRRTSTTPHHLF